jgi:primosomal protein N' (replication factor Y) (superfamily II helicase)
LKKPSPWREPLPERHDAGFYCDVILPVPIPKTFTYAIPSELTGLAVEGQRVLVQFGRKKILTGVIARVHRERPKAYAARDILDVLDDLPLITASQIAFFEWMSAYYLAPIGDVLTAALPAGLKLSSESQIHLHPACDPEVLMNTVSDKEALLLEALQRSGSLAYKEAGRVLGLKSCHAVVKSLLNREAIILLEEVKERYKPKVLSCVRLRDSMLEEGALESLMNRLDRRPRQQEVLLGYLQMVPVFHNPALNASGIAKESLLAKGVSASSLDTLISKGVFERFSRVVPRFTAPPETGSAEILLSPLQMEVRDRILAGFEQNQAVLLHGITGSGKTEIYIDLANQVMAQGGQVLYLLPEIALTTQIVNRLVRVFGEKMGVYHSRFSDNERVEVWKGVATHRFGIVVGVRSAIFLPFDHLDLVIIDEEHEPSYKQFDPSPRYHARDAAQVLARLHHAKVLLGSATPSMESYYLAQSGKYALVNLEERYGRASLPRIFPADLTKERREKRMKGEFSSLLLDHIGATLGRGEQVMIFQNRRGYSPYVQCQECGWVAKCQHCAVSLTYHLDSRDLKCHYCGYTRTMPPRCEACGSTRLNNRGYGTEKLEEDLTLLFPGARVQRMDLDTTRSRHSYQKIIEDFEFGSIDILVGTQMITKGLDFDRVGLVGIFDIDRMLNFPDFRSAERGFQLAVQVSGRAGRRDKPGEVVVQTHDTEQKILDLIARHDYLSFYRQELPERKEFQYPPFYRLIKISVKHRNPESADAAANRLFELLTAELPPVPLAGPYEPLVARIRNLYIREIMVKIPRNSGELEAVKSGLLRCADRMLGDGEPRQAMLVFDVDPY